MNEDEILPFDFERDMGDVLQTWSETGWFEGEERQEKQIRAFFEANDGRSVVGQIAGRTESVTHRTLGFMRYDQSEIPAGGITAVTTSRIARKRGLASRGTARSVAHLGDEGAAVALLGMFEQGFYDRFGFGVGPYENEVYVYPGALNVPVDYRTPERFDLEEDIEEVHAAMVTRYLPHGGLVIGGERSTSAGLQIDDEVRVFGYRTDGAISHFVAVTSKGEHGPDRIIQWAYATQTQCLELLRMVQEWGDQVDLVRFTEPRWMQAQDLIVHPGHEFRRTGGSKAESRIDADAWWQLRILDLQTCIRAMRPSDEAFSVSVQVSDPIDRHLRDGGYEGSWTSLEGTWNLRFGETNRAERIEGIAPGDADVVTSVGALSRWWFGVVPASTLAVLGEIEADPDVLTSLDRLTAHLPKPQIGWDL